jgi:phosphoglycerol transferase
MTLDFKKIVAPALIALMISAVFIYFYQTCFDRKVPIAYEGDAFSVLTTIQGYAEGDTNPVTPRFLERLNAPFQGAWSDFPQEKFVFWPAGFLVSWLGLAQGSTVYVMILQVLAGLSFYFAGKFLLKSEGREAWLAAGAILFGLAPYAFLRNLQHLALTAYWPVPLMVMALIWLGWPERTRFTHRGGVVFSCTAAFIGGNFNPYYLGPFLVLLSLLALGEMLRRKWLAVGILGLVFASAVLGFILQNIDTFIHLAQSGKNPEAVSRNLWWMAKFSLYLPDLFFPRAHMSDWVSKLSWSIYHGRVPEQLWGESQTAYIGLVAGGGLVALLACGVILISARKYEAVSPFFWLSAGVILFSVAGGVNYLLGSFGFVLLRAANRSSIMLACIALYFLCEQGPSKIGKGWKIFLATFLVAVGVWDQLPKYPKWEEDVRQRAWNDFERDREFFPALEAALPKGAMVFEFPVKDYPEMGPIREMGDYEHFRPILHTQDLRVSYGAIKGRGDTTWQKALTSKTPEEIRATLEKHGFAAILINRKAYEDAGQGLQAGLESAGAKPLMENQDFFVLGLQPNPNPVLPEIIKPIQKRRS